MDTGFALNATFIKEMELAAYRKAQKNKKIREKYNTDEDFRKKQRASQQYYYEKNYNNPDSDFRAKMTKSQQIWRAMKKANFHAHANHVDQNHVEKVA